MIACAHFDFRPIFIPCPIKIDFMATATVLCHKSDFFAPPPMEMGCVKFWFSYIWWPLVCGHCKCMLFLIAYIISVSFFFLFMFGVRAIPTGHPTGIPGYTVVAIEISFLSAHMHVQNDSKYVANSNVYGNNSFGTCHRPLSASMGRRKWVQTDIVILSKHHNLGRNSRIIARIGRSFGAPKLCAFDKKCSH